MPLICTFREDWPVWLGGILCLDKYVAIAVGGPTPRSGGGGERRQHEEERMWPPLVVVKNRQLQSIWSAERAEWWTEYCFGRNSTVDRSIDPWTRSRYQSGQSQLIKRFSCCTTNHQHPPPPPLTIVSVPTIWLWSVLFIIFIIGGSTSQHPEWSPKNRL